MFWYWVAGGAVVVLLGLLSRRGERGDETFRGTGGSEATRLPADIDGLVRAGRKIEAIKLYRAQHGVDLKAAKDAIDARSRELGQ
jgi:ribosomal protein L7/L12